MGHHLPPSCSYILHRKNTGRYPLYLDVRKFNQYNWHVYFQLTQVTTRPLLAKPYLHFQSDFVTKSQVGTIFYTGPNSHGCCYVPCTLMNTLPLSHPPIEQEICKSVCALKLYEGKNFCLFCSPMNLMDLKSAQHLLGTL